MVDRLFVGIYGPHTFCESPAVFIFHVDVDLEPTTADGVNVECIRADLQLLEVDSVASFFVLNWVGNTFITTAWYPERTATLWRTDLARWQ